jgi:hypothetical protein
MNSAPSWLMVPCCEVEIVAHGVVDPYCVDNAYLGMSTAEPCSRLGHYVVVTVPKLPNECDVSLLSLAEDEKACAITCSGFKPARDRLAPAALRRLCARFSVCRLNQYCIFFCSRPPFTVLFCPGHFFRERDIRQVSFSGLTVCIREVESTGVTSVCFVASVLRTWFGKCCHFILPLFPVLYAFMASVIANVMRVSFL